MPLGKRHIHVVLRLLCSLLSLAELAGGRVKLPLQLLVFTTKLSNLWTAMYSNAAIKWYQFCSLTSLIISCELESISLS